MARHLYTTLIFKVTLLILSSGTTIHNRPNNLSHSNTVSGETNGQSQSVPKNVMNVGVTADQIKDDREIPPPGSLNFLPFNAQTIRDRLEHGEPRSMENTNGKIASSRHNNLLLSPDMSPQVPESPSQLDACFPPFSFIDDEVITVGPCRVMVKGKTADCRGRNLKDVPQDMPKYIRGFLLSYNALSSDALSAGMFANYTNLTHLWLNSNQISHLPDGIFEGLDNLVAMNLHNNTIILNEDLRASKAFFDLNDTLECLILNGNTNDTSKLRQKTVYPDLALSGLKKLATLYLDGLRDKDFKEGFSRLTKLRNLTLSGFHEGFCNMYSLNHSTFSPLSSLYHLNISDCNLNGSRIDPKVFKPLYQLKSLDVSYNFDLGIESVGDFMFGLKDNSHFKYLKMQFIGTRFAPCIIVYNHTLRYFKNTGLEIIEAMDNEIENIEIGAITQLPPTLKTLNLTNNKISFGAYWKDMASMSGLEFLHLDGYQLPYKFPLFFPSEDLHCPRNPRVDEHNRIYRKQQMLHSEGCLCGDSSCSDQKEKFMLPLPPNLQRFTMHSNSLAYVADSITFCETNKLQEVDLSNNLFKRLNGPILGVTHLVSLNLSSCYIETIGADFFDNFPNLVHLNLFQNTLSDCLNEDEDGKIFDKLYYLKYLNLSHNSIFRLSEKAFTDLVNLETLDLSENQLSHLSFSLSRMENLKFLDLHINALTDLPKHIADDIQALLDANKTIEVDMRKTPIACTCENLGFLEWVLKAGILVGNKSEYYCSYNTENHPSVRMPQGYEEEVQRLRRECASNVGLFLGVIGATFLVIFFIVGLILYQFRWTLRYWYHAAKLRISSNSLPSSEEFEYDVFVSYSNEDVDFVLQELIPHLREQRELKLMIHGEAFPVGRQVADNIYNAVRQCRKTLVVVTRNMLASYWCTYELQMARLESISTGRNVLVFLFLEEISTSEMSVEVLSYIKTNTYIPYPRNPQHRETFWNKLADDLRGR